MSEHDLIVVGVDGSDDALRAVRYGAGIALLTGAELLLANAVDDTLMAGAWGVVYDPEVLHEAGVNANDVARQRAFEAGLPEERVRTEVIMGSPGGVLTRLSEVASLLVLGRRAASGLERMFVGSTSVAVVTSAACPVVVISSAANPDEVGDKKTIGVAVNTNPGSKSTLEAGFQQAVLHKSKLEIVHVIQPPVGIFGPKLSPEELDQQILFAKGGIEALTAPLAEQYPDVDFEIIVVADSPINELVSRSSNYDLLVLGITDSAIPGVQVGGLMRGLLAHALCPLYVAA
uniref:universal stress protein n=1 Tax=Tessaracoccus timonensis TaxID=2161816 RepID=UPI000D5609AB|nr:universal stress protein [Tessaracoccus timonensis]